MIFFVTLLLFIILFFERLIYTLSLKESPGQILDRLICKATISSYLLIVFVGFLDFIIKREANLYSLLIGFSFVFLGVILRRFSIEALGNGWSIYVRNIDNQQLVKKGPYQYLRHPYYMSVLLELLGVSILFYSRLAFFLLLLVQVPLLIIRILIEEKFHKLKFGKR